MPPAVRPEEEIDFRSLAERLEENRMKKEEEHAEKYKLSNMIYSGMDDDEFEHIEKLEEKKREDEKQVRDNETDLLLCRSPPLTYAVFSP